MRFGEKDNRGKMPFLSYHIESTRYQHDLSLSIIIFVICLRWQLSGVSCDIIYSPLPVIEFWGRESDCIAHTWWGWNYAPPFWGQSIYLNYSELYCKGFVMSSSFIYLFHHLFKSMNLLIVILYTLSCINNSIVKYDFTYFMIKFVQLWPLVALSIIPSFWHNWSM